MIGIYERGFSSRIDSIFKTSALENSFSLAMKFRMLVRMKEGT